jgi:hypothetical protein
MVVRVMLRAVSFAQGASRALQSGVHGEANRPVLNLGYGPLLE